VPSAATGVEGGYPDRSGYADAEERSGILHELHLGIDTVTPENYSERNPAGLDDTWVTL
jgi:hypothetical protein